MLSIDDVSKQYVQRSKSCINMNWSTMLLNFPLSGISRCKQFRLSLCLKNLQRYRSHLFGQDTVWSLRSTEIKLSLSQHTTSV